MFLAAAGTCSPVTGSCAVSFTDSRGLTVLQLQTPRKIPSVFLLQLHTRCADLREQAIAKGTKLVRVSPLTKAKTEVWHLWITCPRRIRDRGTSARCRREATTRRTPSRHPRLYNMSYVCLQTFFKSTGRGRLTFDRVGAWCSKSQHISRKMWRKNAIVSKSSHTGSFRRGSEPR